MIILLFHRVLNGVRTIGDPFPGEQGHMAQGCKKPRCYNCETPGHVASDGDMDPLCGVCLQSDHHVPSVLI